MKMVKKFAVTWLFINMSVCVTSSFAANNAEGLNLPMVPTSVVNNSGEMQVQPIKQRKPSKRTGGVVSMRSNSNQFIITVTPGINQVLPIALSHINRIVTPFDTPFVNTVSDATIEAHENVLYVATNSEVPVTLFITPDVNDESMAISLTLAPRKIPPIEATLKFDKKVASNYRFSNKKAEKWEVEQPYVETIKKTLKHLALGKLPSGYSMGPIDEDSIKPTCIQEGFSYDFLNGQYLKGHNFVVIVGTIRNTSKVSKEIDETRCIDGHIVAVSSWPHTVFEPDQLSEMYVIMRTDYLQEDFNLRPSLLESE